MVLVRLVGLVVVEVVEEHNKLVDRQLEHNLLHTVLDRLLVFSLNLMKKVDKNEYFVIKNITGN